MFFQHEEQQKVNTELITAVSVAVSKFSPQSPVAEAINISCTEHSVSACFLTTQTSYYRI